MYAIDEEYDLAVVRIRAESRGTATPERFEFIPIADSDDLNFGDDLVALGYPTIGGDTVNLTRGAVSGFIEDEATGERKWIKTDATIARGNSGGAALNSGHELVGIPTIQGAGEGVDPADCRPLQDTNNDGEFDESDICTPLGGYINGLRPANLASEILKQAETAEPLTIDELTVWPETDGNDDAEPTISDLRFKIVPPGGNALVEEVTSLPSAPDRVCARVHFENMAQGDVWNAVWLRDGEIEADSRDEGGFQWDEWDETETDDTAICTPENQAILDGAWQLVVFEASTENGVEDSIYVGDEHPETDLKIENALEDRVICYLRVTPSASRGLGQDILGEGTLPPGNSTTLKVGAGDHQVNATDCDGEVLYESTEVIVPASGASLEIKN